MSRNPAVREKLVGHINDLRKFTEKVLFSEKREDHGEGEQEIFRIWKLERDPQFALNLVLDCLEKIENRPHAARFHYLAGRIQEEMGKPEDAAGLYERALRSLFHPGLRKDLVLYRLARLHDRAGRKSEAYKSFASLVNRYPLSRLSRSGFYWLYKADYRSHNLTGAHDRLSRLLDFRSLIPSHRERLLEILKKVSAEMNISEMDRLRGYSRTGGSEFPYYVGKVLENDLRDTDRAIAKYEEYLRSHPNLSRSRDLVFKIASLYEKKGDYVHSISWLDSYLKSLSADPRNLDLIVRIGNLVEDRLNNPDLAVLFYENVAREYAEIAQVKDFAKAKIRRLAEKRRAKAEKPRAPRKVKREYSEEDEEILDELADIKSRLIDDLQDFTKAEREMNDLWEANSESAATLDIMKALVSLSDELLMDPQKAGEYYEKWINQNPDDPLLGEITMAAYDLYMEKVKDGQKALKLLETFIKANPTSAMVWEAEFKLAKANELLVLNFDEARRAYQRIIDTKRNDEIVHESYFRMGYVLREGFADYTNAIRIWEEMNTLFYNNKFAADAQFAVAFTYEAYLRDYTKARENYEKILNLYPNSPLQNQVRDALLRIGGKK